MMYKSMYLSKLITALLVVINFHCVSQTVLSEFGRPCKIIESPRIKQFQHLSWPKAEILDDGTMVVGVCAGYEHTGSNCPAVAFSRDGGKSFGPLNVLAYFEPASTYKSCGNIAMGKTEKDSILLLAMAFDSDKSNIYGWKLKDVNQEKWEKIDTGKLGPNKTGSVFGLIMQTGDSLAVVGHYRKGSAIEKGIWIAYSQDGNHWGNPYTIAEGNYYEPVVIYNNHKFVGVARIKDNLGSNTYADIFSENGKNWTVSESDIREEKNTVLPSPCLFTDPQNPSKIYALVTVRDYRNNKLRAIDGIYLWERNVNVPVWKKKAQLIDFPNINHSIDDFGYPWVIPLGEGRFFMVFYCGEKSGPNSIWGMHFDIDKIEK